MSTCPRVIPSVPSPIGSPFSVKLGPEQPPPRPLCAQPERAQYPPFVVRATYRDALPCQRVRIVISRRSLPLTIVPLRSSCCCQGGAPSAGKSGRSIVSSLCVILGGAGEPVTASTTRPPTA